MVKIKIDNLNKSFGDKQVLKGLSFEVYQGEILCIIGKSGTGKSVVMKNLVGIIKPDSGSIRVDGVSYTDSDEKTRLSIQSKYGILFQGAALFDSMNIFDNVAFGLRRKGLPEDQVEEIVSRMLLEVGLSGVEQKKSSELSGGMQKRAGLARAIALHPEIMLYDEPTTGVDPITGGVVDRLIVKMRDLYGITSIVVTHDMKSVYRISDRIVMLHEGRIIFTGTVNDLQRTDNIYVKQFIKGTAQN